MAAGDKSARRKAAPARRGRRLGAPARAEPERTCAVTRTGHPQEALIRFVADPAGIVTPDVAHRLPGRGVWVLCRRAIVDEAIRRNAFARGLKATVSVPPNLTELTYRLLRRRALEALSIANKAGDVIQGFEKVREAFNRGDVAGLVAASDGADDGRAKLRALARQLSGHNASSSSAKDRPAEVGGSNSGGSDLALHDSSTTNLRPGEAVIYNEITEAGTDPEPGLRSASPAFPDGGRDRSVIEIFSSAELGLAIGRPNVVHAAVMNGGAGRNFLKETQRLLNFDLASA